jgi:hypothetical protein
MFPNLPPRLSAAALRDQQFRAVRAATIGWDHRLNFWNLAMAHKVRLCDRNELVAKFAEVYDANVEAALNDDDQSQAAQKIRGQLADMRKFWRTTAKAFNNTNGEKFCVLYELLRLCPCVYRVLFNETKQEIYLFRKLVAEVYDLSDKYNPSHPRPSTRLLELHAAMHTEQVAKKMKKDEFGESATAIKHTQAAAALAGTQLDVEVNRDADAAQAMEIEAEADGQGHGGQGPDGEGAAAAVDVDSTMDSDYTDSEEEEEDDSAEDTEDGE